MKDKNEIMIPGEVIMSKIYLIRGVKVMLDRDLAKLYEMEDWKSQIVISNKEKMGLRKPP